MQSIFHLKYEANQEMLGRGKVTLFNVGSSFSNETGINGSRRYALYPPASVSAPFYGYSKLWLHGSEESRSRRLSQWRSNRRPLAQKAAQKANWATTAPVIAIRSCNTNYLGYREIFLLFLRADNWCYYLFIHSTMPWQRNLKYSVQVFQN